MSECPFLPTASTDPAVSQISQQLIQLQQYLTSPTNLAYILSKGAGTSMIGDGTWITVAPSGISIKISHIGPGAVTLSVDPVNALSIATDGSGNKFLDIGMNQLQFDAKGHKAAVDSDSIELALTEVTNITDFKVLDSAQEIQVKTQVQWILASAAKSDWTTIYTGTTCPDPSPSDGSV
jgi:hypothetical protein